MKGIFRLMVCGTNLALGGEGGTTLPVVHGYNPTSARTVQMNIPGLP